MNVELLYDRILVKKIEKTKTKGGLFLPPTATKDPSRPIDYAQGIVVKTGSGRTSATGEKIPMSVAEGDLVYFPDHPQLAKTVTIEDEEYTILDEPVIIGFVKKGNYDAK
jgi:chaperonin GroES